MVWSVSSLTLFAGNAAFLPFIWMKQRLMMKVERPLPELKPRALGRLAGSRVSARLGPGSCERNSSVCGHSDGEWLWRWQGLNAAHTFRNLKKLCLKKFNLYLSLLHLLHNISAWFSILKTFSFPKLLGKKQDEPRLSLRPWGYKAPRVEKQSIVGVLSVFLSGKSLGEIENDGFKLD